VRSIADHPLVLMRELGLRISLASDDPALLGHDLSDVYRLTQRARHLSDAELASIARESADSAFADDDVKKSAALEIERWLVHARRRDQEASSGR